MLVLVRLDFVEPTADLGEPVRRAGVTEHAGVQQGLVQIEDNGGHRESSRNDLRPIASPKLAGPVAGGVTMHRRIVPARQFAAGDGRCDVRAPGAAGDLAGSGAVM
jgi:hypothetical protein